MSTPFLLLYLLAMVLWILALYWTLQSLGFLVRRVGHAQAWPVARVRIPRTDLFGLLMGVVAVAALIAGRETSSQEWAAAIILVVLMIVASVFDRVILMPSLEASHRRLAHGEDAELWEVELRWYWRLSAVGRGGTFAAGVLAILFGLAA